MKKLLFISLLISFPINPSMENEPKDESFYQETPLVIITKDDLMEAIFKAHMNFLEKESQKNKKVWASMKYTKVDFITDVAGKTCAFLLAYAIKKQLVSGFKEPKT